jgi:predicted alternative tryptophan synthase beta-subunit
MKRSTILVALIVSVVLGSTAYAGSRFPLISAYRKYKKVVRVVNNIKEAIPFRR